MLDHLVEEVVDLDPLPEQPPLHVGERGDDRVDRPLLRFLAQFVDGKHAGGATGPSWSLGAHGRPGLVTGHFVFFQGPDRALVPVLGAREPPDADDREEDEDEIV